MGCHRRRDRKKKFGRIVCWSSNTLLVLTGRLFLLLFLECVDAAGQEAGRSRSRASTTRSRTLNVIPRSQRRGLLGRFAVVPEVDRPYDYKNSTKWGITLTIAVATAAAPLGSSIFYRTQVLVFMSNQKVELTNYSCSP